MSSRGRLVEITKSYKLYYNDDDGTTTTFYRDGSYTSCPVVPDDRIHADALGITPEQHRFIHEFIHHRVGQAVYRQPSSPVLFRQAHNVSHDLWNPPIGSGWAGWEEEEWLVSAITYHVFRMDDKDYGARIWLESRGYDVENILSDIRLSIMGVLSIDLLGNEV